MFAMAKLMEMESTEENKGALVEENKVASTENVEGTLEEIMTKVYAGIPEENLPALMDMPVDSETVEGFLGTTEVSFKEAVAREPMMSSVPHSVVLVRLNDAKDAEATVAKIKESVNPRKWICVEASNVIVKGYLERIARNKEQLKQLRGETK